MSGCKPSTLSVRPFYCFGAYYLGFLCYFDLFSYSRLPSLCFGLSPLLFLSLNLFNLLGLSLWSLLPFLSLLMGLLLSCRSLLNFPGTLEAPWPRPINLLPPLRSSLPCNQYKMYARPVPIMSMFFLFILLDKCIQIHILHCY